MDVFNLQLPEDDENKSGFENINNWFDFMNSQFEKLENIRSEIELDNILNDLGIDKNL